MTERLYYTDSHLIEFTATVTGQTEWSGRPGLLLDRTAFYPTGGGQPHDTGTLNDVPVVDVVETDAGQIVHVLAESVAEGTRVTGRIDWPRRLDHIQQHTGQHILSQAFVQACGAATRSFHLGVDSSTIDIELERPTAQLMAAAEEIANRIVFENRPVAVHLAEADTLAQLPLRKETEREGCVRLIEVKDYDWSPCGGTHAKATGALGLIVVRGWDRAKKLCRVEFLCGGRALRDYRQANQTALSVAAQFSAGRDAIPALVTNLIDQNKEQARRLRELLEQVLVTEAAALYAQGQERGAFRLIQQIFPARDGDELKLLAQKITQQGPAVVLLASTNNLARLVFARSAGLTPDMGKLLGQACQALGGRGGGRPELAQGGAPDLNRLPAVLAEIAQAL